MQPSTKDPVVLGHHVGVVTSSTYSSMFSAISAVLATPTLDLQRLRLAPQPTASRASGKFVTRTLLDWRLGRVIHAASLAVSELVTGWMMHAGTETDPAMAWHLRALRLTVRGYVPVVPRQLYSHVDPPGRSLSLVAGLSGALGFLPTADGGTVVWAGLEAARPTPTGQPTSSQSWRRSPGVTEVDRRPSAWAERICRSTGPPGIDRFALFKPFVGGFASPN